MVKILFYLPKTILTILILAIWISACANPFIFTPQENQITTYTSSITSTKPAATTFQINPSHTPTQILRTTTPTVLTPTTLSTITPYITSTITPTMEPTLNAEQKEYKVTSWLQNNGGCRLPCFWGYRPGETNWEEMKIDLTQKGFGWSGPYGQDHNIYYTGLDFQKSNVVVSMGVLVSYGKVDGLGIGLGGNDLPTKAQNYTIPHLIQSLGIPSRILIETQNMEGLLFTGYSLILFYDDKGIGLKYSGSAEILRDAIMICPAAKVTGNSVNLNLQNSTSKRRIDDLSGLFGAQATFSLPIEKATDISIDDFYNMVIGNSSTKCFQTPKDKWPISGGG